MTVNELNNFTSFKVRFKNYHFGERVLLHAQSCIFVPYVLSNCTLGFSLNSIRPNLNRIPIAAHVAQMFIMRLMELKFKCIICAKQNGG